MRFKWDVRFTKVSFPAVQTGETSARAVHLNRGMFL